MRFKKRRRGYKPRRLFKFKRRRRKKTYKRGYLVPRGGIRL